MQPHALIARYKMRRSRPTLANHSCLSLNINITDENSKKSCVLYSKSEVIIKVLGLVLPCSACAAFSCVILYLDSKNMDSNLKS